MANGTLTREERRLFDLGFPATGSEEIPGLRETGRLGFSDVDEPKPTFEEAFLNQVGIGSDPGEIDLEDLPPGTPEEKIAALQASQRFKTPGFREINETIEALLGKTTGTQRANPNRDTLSPWQHGLLFVSDIVAMGEGRPLPSTQLAVQMNRAEFLEDQARREAYAEGTKMVIEFSKMLAESGLSQEDRAIAAAGQIENARKIYGEGFGALLFALSAKPSRAEALQTFINNERHFNRSASDLLWDLSAFQAGYGDVEGSVETIRQGIEDGTFEADVQSRAPAMMVDKMDDFLAGLRKLGGDHLDLVGRIERGEDFTPSEVINAHHALPVNSPGRLDPSVISTLANNTKIFAGDFPSMVTAEQADEYQKLLDAAELGPLVTLLGGEDSDDPGRLVTVSIGSRESRRLRKNGYIELDALQGLNGDGGTSDSTKIQLLNLFTKQSERFRGINSSFKTILNSAKRSPGGNVAMVFAFMKMLDPTSVVREGEQLTARQARAVGDTMATYMNRILTGETLTPTQVADFLDIAERIWTGSAKEQVERENEFGRLASDWGIENPDLIRIDMLGEMRNRLPKGPVTREAFDAMKAQLGPEATMPQVKEALIKEGYEFPQ